MNDKPEILILVTAKFQLKRAYAVSDKLSSRGQAVLIVWGEEAGSVSDGYPAKRISDYQKISGRGYYAIRQQAYDMFYALAEEKISGDLTLRKFTEYKGVSLWDLSVKYVFSEIIPLFYYIGMACKILDTEKPRQVYLLGASGIPEQVFMLLCAERKIPCSVEGPAKERRPGSPLFIKKIKRFGLSFYFWVANTLKSPRIRKHYPRIFFAPVERFFVSMLPVIKKYGEDERLAINTPYSGTANTLKAAGIFYTEFSGYKLYDLWGGSKWDFLKRMRQVFWSPDFRKKLKYEGLSLWPVMERIFANLIEEEFPERMRDVDITRRILLGYKPKVVVLVSYAYDIALIAKSMSIPCIAIQSGHVSEFYHFSPPRADLLTIDGDYWKRFLLEQGVSPEKIRVTGDPRYDIYLNGIFSPADLNFGNDKKVVLFAGTYTSIAMGVSEDEKIEEMRAVCGAIKDIPDAYLVIKIHPCETDIGKYREIAREMGMRNYTIIRDMPMVKLIRVCDVLITHFSGAGYESVLLDKSTIVLNYGSDFCSDDIWDFKKYGAVTVVDNLKGLKAVVEKSLYDTQAISALECNRREYVFPHAYKMDGQAAERVKEAINGIC